MLCGLAMFTACSDDNGSNPTFTEPTDFVLNEPAFAGSVLDLASSSSLHFTCSQPNYGYPAAVTYNIYVATSADMADAQMIQVNSKTTTLAVDPALVASTLTTMMLEKGKVEADFPMTIPVYFQAEAVMNLTTGDVIEASRIKSNVVQVEKTVLKFSLAPVTTPDNLYLVGNFNGWNWDTSLKMVQVYEAPHVFWHLVFIDDSGIKFNMNTAWDGGEVGFGGITINPESELGDEIIDNGGNIASSKPGWYLMIITCSVEGRDIKYDVTFNKPEVWLMGTITPGGSWAEKEDGCLFSVPTVADGEFVSPPFANDSSGDGGVRAYVKVPGYDWWKSEFITGIGDDPEAISYRGMGSDQDRIQAEKNSILYFNFTKETGRLEKPAKD